MENANELVNFFLGAYAQMDNWLIALEFTGAFFGVLSVVLASRENIWVYPIGIISTGIYIYITFLFSLYGDMIINAYYTCISLYGWYRWGSENKSLLKVSSSKAKDHLHAGILFVSSSVLIFGIYAIDNKLQEGYSWVDILTTGIFSVAMYQMAKKKLESWLFWILGNVISVPLYVYKGLPLTAVQFMVFAILAIYGYLSWGKKIRINSPNKSN